MAALEIYGGLTSLSREKLQYSTNINLWCLFLAGPYEERGNQNGQTPDAKIDKATKASLRHNDDGKDGAKLKHESVECHRGLTRYH